MKTIFKFLASLKLAVVLLAGLAASLAAATFIESLYDTRTAQYWVYRSWWFAALLFVLGVNILAVMIDRWPWKPRHTPFLLAHIGILMLLAGSYVTQKYGLDGSIRVTEGETTSMVELENTGLMVIDGSSVVRVPVKWVPPEVEFRKFNLKDHGLPYDLVADRFISHADVTYSFNPDNAGNPIAKPAIQVKLLGGRMAIQQEYWLWSGDPSWSQIQAGPAILAMGEAKAPEGQPSLIVTPEAGGGVRYLATSSEGKKVSGTLAADKIGGFTLDPKWRGGVQIVFEKWLGHAMPQANFSPSRMQHGPEAPPSAIHLTAGRGGPGSEVWLGLGERAILDVGGRQVELRYYPDRVILPFQVKLDHFKIDHYDGTRDPSSYSSSVTVIDRGANTPVEISMNEPLHFRGTTLYQASYEDAMPRPVTSIFSVNRDPGRTWKYLGSLLIVLGSILLFAMKYFQKKRTTTSGANA